MKPFNLSQVSRIEEWNVGLNVRKNRALAHGVVLATVVEKAGMTPAMVVMATWASLGKDMCAWIHQQVE